ncbi:hypothetical protein QYG_1461 [Escherichia coli B7-1]|nr:hypothetical protein QYG_1461 [Escherichia coli B7-1]
MIWQPEFTDKTLSRKPGAVQSAALCQQGNCVIHRMRQGPGFIALPGDLKYTI